MASPTRSSCTLHAPSADGDYRGHLYEARTLCRKTGWVALGEGQVTCSACLRRLQRRRSRAAPQARASERGWTRLMGLATAARRRHGVLPEPAAE